MADASSKMKTQQGWQRVRLGDIARLRKGLMYKSSNYSNVHDGMAFLTLKSICRGGGFNLKGIKYFSGEYSPSAVVNAGDLVIANTDITRDAEVVGAPMLISNISEKPVLISMDLSVLDVNRNKADIKFLYYILQAESARSFMKEHSSGSTVLHLKTKDVPNFSFLMPTLKDQQKIAEILGSVDEEIQKTDEIIITARKLKEGLLNHLFYSGVSNRKIKKTEIGSIPENWNVELLDLVAKRGSGHTPNKKHAEYWNGGIKWVSLSDSNRLDNRYIYETVKEISFEGINNSSAVLHPKDTVIVSRDAGIGKAALLGSDNMAVSQHFIAWQCGEKLLPEYLYYWFQSKKKELEQIATGTTIKTIGLSFFKKLQIPLPAIKEQKQIGEIFWSIDDKIDINLKTKEKLLLLKKGLMRDLLSGKVRVDV